MNLNLFHDLTFYTLYAGLALTAFVAVERIIFYAMTRKKTLQLEDALAPGAGTPPPELLAQNNVPANVSRLLLDRMPKNLSVNNINYPSEPSNTRYRSTSLGETSSLLGGVGRILGASRTLDSAACCASEEVCPQARSGSASETCTAGL